MSPALPSKSPRRAAAKPAADKDAAPLNATAAKLLVAAGDLMIERNSTDISLSDIAQKSGVNAALVKYHFGNKDGLVHISQLSMQRVAKTTDVVKEGEKVKVKLLGFDDRGKVRLSMRVVDQATGEDLEAKQKAERDAQNAAEQSGAPLPEAGE